MSNLKRTAEAAQLSAPEAKWPKLSKDEVKTEIPDDYPVYPTLMDLDYDYRVQVLMWDLYLLELAVGISNEELPETTVKAERQWYQFEFGSLVE